ncbi:Amidohydrolase family protein [Acidisarcina polymorpha]|uniref:Amidohydrolase family protein n=1 Tax=Acidisarcina polymorpha TaxID=2211140 RepID=A0A2Z5G4G3_9BACT|nr:amidohydrolase family protein [Acidisarcina polymorpha]AXC13724.1 Amidohydrolase family protein [Acidisarcina polymorpha]
MSLVRAVVAVAVGVVISAPVSAQPANSGVIVLKDVRLIDGTGMPPLVHATIVIQDGRIAAIDTGSNPKTPLHAQVYEYSGKTVIPGLINAHGHLGLVSGTENSATAFTHDNVVRELKQYEGYGVTDMLSLGGNRDLVFDLRREQQAGMLGGADIFTAGRGIGAPGGAPPLPLGPDQIDRPTTVDEARADVRSMAAQKVDIIKIWVDDLHGKVPKMKPEVYRAIIDEAHKQHLRVAAHVYALADAKSLVSDGVDVLAHSVRDQFVDEELIAEMKRNRTWYIPTFTVDDSFFIYARHPEWMDTPFFEAAAGPQLAAMLKSASYVAKVNGDPSTAQHEKDFENGQENLKLLFDAGVHIGFGTDSGAMPSRIPGFAEHRELELMVRAGLTPMQAIVCATGKNAELLQAEDRGTLVVGKRADLLVLDGNPLDGITNVHELVSIVHDGQVIRPMASTATPR